MEGLVADEAVFLFLQIIGTVAFAASGVFVAARAGMDWLGGMVLACLVAVGGGTIRDLVLGKTPVFWLEDAWPLPVALGTAVLMFGWMRIRPSHDLTRWWPLVIADAIGLSVFAIHGTAVSLEAGESLLESAVLGIITGVGGGVIRDVLAQERPLVLRGQIYAGAAAVGTIVYGLLVMNGFAVEPASWIAIALVVVVRILSYARDWNLPRVAPLPKKAASG